MKPTDAPKPNAYILSEQKIGTLGDLWSALGKAGFSPQAVAGSGGLLSVTAHPRAGDLVVFFGNGTEGARTEWLEEFLGSQPARADIAAVYINGSPSATESLPQDVSRVSRRDGTGVGTLDKILTLYEKADTLRHVGAYDPLMLPTIRKKLTMCRATLTEGHLKQFGGHLLYALTDLPYDDKHPFTNVLAGVQEAFAIPAPLYRRDSPLQYVVAGMRDEAQAVGLGDWFTLLSNILLVFSLPENYATRDEFKPDGHRQLTLSRPAEPPIAKPTPPREPEHVFPRLRGKRLHHA